MRAVSSVERMRALGTLAVLLLTALGAYAQPAPRPARYMPNQVLVRFEPRRMAVHALTPSLWVDQVWGGRIDRYLDDAGDLVLVRLPPTLDVETVLSRLQVAREVTNALGEPVDADVVVRAEPNFLYHAVQAPIASDPCFVEQWAINPQQGNNIHVTAEWAKTRGNGAVVAVIDSGIDISHPDLAGRVHRNEAECGGVAQWDDDQNGFVDDCYGYNAIAKGGDPVEDMSGNLAHGTHVAGIIGAAANDQGVVGVSPDSTLAICKALNAKGVGTTADVIDCLRYVAALDATVKVLATSNSYGGPDFSAELKQAIEQQAAAGILFIAAAGNDDSDIGNLGTRFYPASYQIENMIVTAAIDSDGARLSNSNFSVKRVHLVAPGGAILSTQPLTAQATCEQKPVAGVGYASGTSMAAPHVAGVAALIASGLSTTDWKEIKRRIVECGVPDGLSPPVTISGNKLDASAALSCP